MVLLLFLLQLTFDCMLLTACFGVRRIAAVAFAAVDFVNFCKPCAKRRFVPNKFLRKRFKLLACARSKVSYSFTLTLSGICIPSASLRHFSTSSLPMLSTTENTTLPPFCLQSLANSKSASKAFSPYTLLQCA